MSSDKKTFMQINNTGENMKLADTTMESGFSFQQELLLQALEDKP